MPGESDFIEWIRAQRGQTDLVLVPQGDDLAVLKWRGEDLLLVGVDQVLDGVHFDSAVHSPRAIGRKVINRNLSDCAAMGCLPAAAVSTAACRLDADWITPGTCTWECETRRTYLTARSLAEIRDRGRESWF